MGSVLDYFSLYLAEAESLLKQEVSLAEKAVFYSINVPLSKNQFTALVSFISNFISAALQRLIYFTS